MRSRFRQQATRGGALRVLLVEDSEDDGALLLRQLTKAGWQVQVHRVETAETMTEALANGVWDIVIADWSLPRFSAMEAVAIARDCGLEVPLIILSGSVGEEAAIAAMRAGASDVVMKDQPARLIPAVERELADAEIRRRLRSSDSLLARSEKLNALGQMAAGIAHDLINILNPLALHVHALERSLGAEKSELQGQSLTQMKEIAHTGLEVVERLRAYSRGNERPRETIELEPLVHDAVQLARPRAAALQKPVRIHEELDKTSTVSASADEVIAAVVNLVVNAIDAVSGGGSVWVRTVSDGVEAAVEVTDDGPGVPADVEARLFEPFFTTKGILGTGLGLSMVRATMLRHGGSVDFDSAPGGGTTFRLRFPATNPLE